MEDVYGCYAEQLRQGHQFAAEGRFKDALRHYQSAADLAGARALPHVAVGGMWLRLGHAKEALAAFERGLARDPADLDALRGRAAALLAAGRRAEAAQAQQLVANRAGRGANGAPAGPATQMSRADALMVAGEQAHAAGNTTVAISTWLAESADHAQASRYDAALDACLRALAADSSSVRVHLEITRLYAARGWTAQGRERAQLLRHLLALQPDTAIAAELEGLVAGA